MRRAPEPLDAFDHAPIPMVVIDGAAHPIVVNAAWRQHAGMAALDGGTLRLTPEVLDEARDVLACGREGLVLETAVACDLTDRSFRARVRPLVADDGHVTGAVIAFEDVSGELAAHRALELQQRLVAYTAHELQTPLMAMTLWHDLLVEPEGADTDRPRALGAIERSARAMGEMIRELLDVTRAAAGALHIDLVTTPLVPLLEDACARAVATAERALEIVATIDPVVGEVQGNPHRLAQVVDTLLARAVRLARSRVDLTADLRDDVIEVGVAHDGTGISAALLPHMLEPFADHDASGGLGLARVSALVALHHGSVVVHSDGVDCGARYVVRLPVTSAR